MPGKTRWNKRRLALLAVALLAPLSGGCLFVAAGAAVGAGAAGYYAITHRLYRDYPRDLAQTTAALRIALADLRFPPSKEEGTDDTVTMETKAPDGSKVSIEVRVIGGHVPADGVTTRVGIHFGMVGDEDASARILDQVGVRLGLAQAQPQSAQQPLRPLPQPSTGATETPPPPLAK
jgi:hypothetical protein